MCLSMALNTKYGKITTIKRESFQNYFLKEHKCSGIIVVAFEYPKKREQQQELYS